MVLAATNRPSELDEAILRRFPQAFEIGIPDRSERANILKVILKGERIEEDIDYDNIARLCEGFTGSDIFELCKQAAYFPVRELLDDEKKGKISLVSTYLSYLKNKDSYYIEGEFSQIVSLFSCFCFTYSCLHFGLIFSNSNGHHCYLQILPNSYH